MILVEDDRDVGVGFGGREHHVPQIRLARVFARPRRRLQDHRRAGFLGRFHDRLDLLEVVDVERGDAVAVLGGVVEHLAQGHESHRGFLPKLRIDESEMGCGVAMAIRFGRLTRS